MSVEEKKAALKLALADIRVEAKHLISNIDVAIEHLDEPQTDNELEAFAEKYDIEQGLKYIQLFV